MALIEGLVAIALTTPPTIQSKKDLNGDGIPDLLYSEREAGNYRLGVLPSIGTELVGENLRPVYGEERPLFATPIRDNELSDLKVYDIDGDGDNDILLTIEQFGTDILPEGPTRAGYGTLLPTRQILLRNDGKGVFHTEQRRTLPRQTRMPYAHSRTCPRA